MTTPMNTKLHEIRQLNDYKMLKELIRCSIYLQKTSSVLSEMCNAIFHLTVLSRLIPFLSHSFSASIPNHFFLPF